LAPSTWQRKFPWRKGKPGRTDPYVSDFSNKVHEQEKGWCQLKSEQLVMDKEADNAGRLKCAQKVISILSAVKNNPCDPTVKYPFYIPMINRQNQAF